MTPFEILHKWPIEYLQKVGYSQATEEFSSSIGDDDADTFLRSTDRLGNALNDLRDCMRNKDYYADWRMLRELHEGLHVDFPRFPLERRKFLLWTLIAEKISQAARTDPSEQIEVLFDLVPLRFIPPLKWLAVQNSHTIEESVAIVSVESGLADEFLNAALSPELAIRLLATLNATANCDSDQMMFVRHLSSQNSVAETADAFAKLVLLSKGKTIHVSRHHTAAPILLDTDSFRYGCEYHQFVDVFEVLSEYNERTELLAKYLTIYHVLENLMYRRPLVSMERERSGRMFALRDFKRIHDVTVDGELETLVQLFLKVFGLRIGLVAGELFKDRIKKNWDAFVTPQRKDGINDLLKLLGMQQAGKAMSSSQMSQGNPAQNFAKLVYFLRNAIVHNKSTEFHLTSSTMTTATEETMSRFLLPTLEEVCFFLIGRENDVVWYSNRALKLY